MAEAVIVCYGEVVKNEAFSGLVLKDGDVLEIVRPVGGGKTAKHDTPKSIIAIGI